METKRIKINDTKNINDEELKEAAQILRDGGLVAFPTETVYGLGGNALDEKAAGKIYAAKGRPSDNPLIAHVSVSYTHLFMQAFIFSMLTIMYIANAAEG